jgi:hypothetical protein
MAIAIDPVGTRATMSMRRFLRGGYRETDAPVHLLVRDRIVGVFVPSQAVEAAATTPSAAAVSEQASAAPDKGSTGGTKAAYQRYARSLKAR